MGWGYLITLSWEHRHAMYWWTSEGVIYQEEHVVSIRYSKDVNSFGFKVSEDGEKWVKDSISGSEKQAYEIFKESFLKMINSVYFGNL